MGVAETLCSVSAVDRLLIPRPAKTKQKSGAQARRKCHSMDQCVSWQCRS